MVEALDDSDLFVSVITLAEITKGIALLAEGQRKRGLSSWILGLEEHFTDRILPVDLATARIWGEVTARAQLQGATVPAADGLIAATAIRSGLHLMTRNTRPVAATGVLLIDPWE